MFKYPAVLHNMTDGKNASYWYLGDHLVTVDTVNSWCVRQCLVNNNTNILFYCNYNQL